MSTLLEKITEYLVNQDVVQGSGIDIFRDFLPDSPSKVIVLHEYGSPRGTVGSEALIRRIQIEVRTSAEDPMWGRDKIWELFRILAPIEGIIDGREENPSTDLWMVVLPLQSPYKVRVDDSNRWMFSFNINTITTREFE